MRTFSLPNTHWHPELDYNAFCRCACEYRGNFYDFIPQDGSGLSISFGDLPFAGELQPINVPGFEALVRGLSAGTRDDVSGLARELNSVLHLLGPCDLCVPWFYARIDPVRRQLEAMGLPQRCEVLADPALESGAAILETNHGTLDASAETQMEEIERGFADVVRHAI